MIRFKDWVRGWFTPTVPTYTNTQDEFTLEQWNKAFDHLNKAFDELQKAFFAEVKTKPKEKEENI